MDAFKTGVFDYIREDIDAISQDVVPRKYFSGGVQVAIEGNMLRMSKARTYADLPTLHQEFVRGGVGSSSVEIQVVEDLSVNQKLTLSPLSDTAISSAIASKEYEKYSFKSVEILSDKIKRTERCFISHSRC